MNPLYIEGREINHVASVTIVIRCSSCSSLTLMIFFFLFLLLHSLFLSLSFSRSSVDLLFLQMLHLRPIFTSLAVTCLYCAIGRAACGRG